MSVDIARAVIEGVRASRFESSIQLYEPTNLINCCQLIVYVRFTQNEEIKTKLSLNHEVSITTKEKNIFNTLNNFSKKIKLIEESLLDAEQMGLPLSLVESLGFKLM